MINPNNDLNYILNQYEAAALKVTSAQPSAFIKKEKKDEKKYKKNEEKSSGEIFGELLDVEIQKLKKR